MASSATRPAALKALALALFAAAAIVTLRFTPARDLLDPERLSALVASAGAWAPVAYVLVYAAGVCLFAPGTLLAVIGAAVFGPFAGFAYVWIGAMLGAGLAFLIGRHLGRDFAASAVCGRLARYDQAIRRNGFAATLYLRLIYFPFSVMNFGMGLTAVTFRDYILGTALGILVGTFVFTFAVGAFREVWISGNWDGLLGWKVLLALGLFVLSLFIPPLVKRFKGDAS